MLRITQSTSAEAAKEYLDQALNRGDYYMKGQEIAGNWGGRGARMLGLEGIVTREALFALLDNRKPDGGALTARTIANRRPGYDFTFDVPKSVSVIFALSGDERIREAMGWAVDATMQEMESEMYARVRKSGAFSDRKTGVMVWADFTHLTSRPVVVDRATELALRRSGISPSRFIDDDGRIALPDPHLHRHVYVINATYDETEAMWKAGEFMRIKRDASYYQAAYHVRLAGELQKLGYEIEPTANAFEIAGVPRSLVEVFSRRTKEIEKKARELGITDPNRKAELGALTRHRKDSSLGMGELRAAWRTFLQPQDAKGIQTVAERAKTAVAAKQKDNAAVASQSIKYALGVELERASTVSEKRLLASALKFAVGNASVASVHHALAGSSNVASATTEDGCLYTTDEVLAEEAALIQFVRNWRGSVGPLVRGTYNFKTQLFAVSTPENEEQRRAVLHVLKSTDGIVGVVGRAGTGKTTLLKEIRAALDAQGRQMLLCAPTADAARGVLRGEGFTSADTVKRFLLDAQIQAKMPGSVLWIDEAGMIGNKDMLALLKLASARGVARVVLSGDPTQIRSVSRGDAFLFLEERAGLSVARLEDIKRQKSPALKAAVEAISRGRVTDGLTLLDKDGKLVTGPSNSYRSSLAKAYARRVASSRRRGRETTALVVCPTHQEGEAITAEIRSELRARQRIGVEERRFPRTVNLSWTEAERANAANYERGLVVQFKLYSKGFVRSERVRVEHADGRLGVVHVRRNDGSRVELPLSEARKFQVYALRELAVSVGDRLRVTETGYDVQRQHRLDGGDIVKVAGFSPEGGIVLENGKVLTAHFGHLNHGYVVTADAAQAKTVDYVFAAIGKDSFGATDMRRVYVAISRARHEAWVYTDDKQGLLGVAARDNARRSGTELVGIERSREIVRQYRIREAQRAQNSPGKAPQPPTPRIPPMQVKRREPEFHHGR